MEVKIKNREWVKNAAIVFLAVLLVLTFFSNTIMNRSLPEAATAMVTSGNIVAKVRGSGTVAANGVHQVRASENRSIRSVMVKAGQEVNAGDVLFVLGEGDETELEQAQDSLRQLEASYQKMSLNMDSPDFTSQQITLDRAAERLNAAENALKLAEERYFDTVVSDPEKKAEKERLDAAIDKLNTEIGSLQAEYEEGLKKIEENGGTYTQKLSELDYYRGLQIIEKGKPEGERQDYSGKIAELEADIENKLPYVDEQIYSNAAEYSYVMNGEIEEIKNRRDELTHMRDSLTVTEGNPTYKAEYEAAELEYKNAEDEWQIADAALQQSWNTYNKSAASTGIDMQLLAEQIWRQREKVQSLAGDEENVITANVSGTVSTVDCTAGDMVLKNDILCTIEVPDMGHTLSFSVTNDQARRLHVGDTASVSNYYWGNSITATLTSIRTDPKNPQGSKLLSFDLTGDVTSGSELTISVGQKSANYDLIIPNSSIKSDSNGSFVLAVTAKNSPLGNRYIAKRVSIEVLASDDVNSAVIADLSNGDYVITTASAPVSSGDQVRMAES